LTIVAACGHAHLLGCNLGLEKAPGHVQTAQCNLVKHMLQIGLAVEQAYTDSLML
jgi:hypothetical protein